MMAMGPELIIVAAGYYGAVFVAIVLLVAVATKRWRTLGLLTACGAVLAGTVAAVSVQPEWRLYSALFFFAAVGLVAMAVTAVVVVIDRWSNRGKSPRTAV
jgi:hypothetical protein